MSKNSRDNIISNLAVQLVHLQKRADALEEKDKKLVNEDIRHDRIDYVLNEKIEAKWQQENAKFNKKWNDLKTLIVKDEKNLEKLKDNVKELQEAEPEPTTQEEKNAAYAKLIVEKKIIEREEKLKDENQLLEELNRNAKTVGSNVEAKKENTLAIAKTSNDILELEEGLKKLKNYHTRVTSANNKKIQQINKRLAKLQNEVSEQDESEVLKGILPKFK